MDVKIFIILLLVGALKYIQSVDVANTYEQYFGTKTPYRVVENTNDSEITFPGCTPHKLWFVVRHGTRSPTESALKTMKQFLPDILSKIIEANEFNPKFEINALKNWKLTYEDTVLTEEGAKEQQQLAKRMKNRFPSLFPNIFSNESYLFRSTNTQRTLASAKNFSLGLFGHKHFEQVYIPPPLNMDPVLKFYKNCRRWVLEVEHKPSEEQKWFHQTDLVSEQLRAMSIALNLTKTLLFDEVLLMFQICCIEHANHKKSVWCPLIPIDMIKILEFSQILLYDHKSGYVNEISYKQACPLLQHMIQFFDSDHENSSATVMFTHDSAVLTFLSHLGLFKNEKKLEYTDFNTSFENKWKLSEIGAFTSNIAFVLLKCEDDAQKIAVFHQERLVQLPGCEELCSLNDFKDIYYDSIYHCELNEMCHNHVDSHNKNK